MKRADWLALLPHRGAMVLLDAVREWDAQHLEARSSAQRAPRNPLRRADGRLHAVALCEVAAQAMAVHGALTARAENTAVPPAWLVSLRDVTLAREFVDNLPGSLGVHVERLLATAAAWQYAFRVEHQGAVLVAGRAAVMLRA